MVDGIISDENTPYWQRRLAQMQLTRILASLEAIIKRERRKGQFDGRRGEDNATLVRDTYFRPLEGQTSNQDADLGMRWSNRMSRLLDGSTFLAVAYSDIAETKMYVSKESPLILFQRQPRRRNFSVKHRELEDIPRQLIQISRRELGDVAVAPI